MEAPNNNTVSDQSSNVSSEDIFSDVPLFATYLKMVLLLLAIPTIIVPASVIIHVIWKNERLHTKYYFFVINLLVTDITTTGRYVYEIFSMILYLFGVTVAHNDIFFVILTIPRVATRYAFVLLAIDRVIGVRFPYRHRKIMTNIMVKILVSVSWLLAAAIAFSIRFTSSLFFAWPFGNYIITPGPIATVLLVGPMLISIIMIVVSNAFLYYSTVQSNIKLRQNRRLAGGDQQKINRLQRLLSALQMQAKPTASALILGGIDCGINIIKAIIFAVINTSVPLSSGIMYVYLFQIDYLIEWCQVMSHAFVYGVYMKEIRRYLHNYKFYQRLSSLFPVRHNKVTPVTTHS